MRCAVQTDSPKANTALIKCVLTIPGTALYDIYIDTAPAPAPCGYNTKTDLVHGTRTSINTTNQTSENTLGFNLFIYIYKYVHIDY